jgi:hypothetical protein
VQYRKRYDDDADDEPSGMTAAARRKRSALRLSVSQRGSGGQARVKARSVVSLVWLL